LHHTSRRHHAALQHATLSLNTVRYPGFKQQPRLAGCHPFAVVHGPQSVAAPEGTLILLLLLVTTHHCKLDYVWVQRMQATYIVNTRYTRLSVASCTLQPLTCSRGPVPRTSAVWAGTEMRERCSQSPATSAALRARRKKSREHSGDMTHVVCDVMQGMQSMFCLEASGTVFGGFWQIWVSRHGSLAVHTLQHHATLAVETVNTQSWTKCEIQLR
jgi:hypothetical protein